MTLRDVYYESIARISVKSRDAAYFLRYGESRYSSLPSSTGDDISAVDLEQPEGWREEVELDQSLLE